VKKELKLFACTVIKPVPEFTEVKFRGAGDEESFNASTILYDRLVVKLL